ncbi:MAG: hypothetical protein ACI4CS_00885, partial [Candidatus Weimeria sp.]
MAVTTNVRRAQASRAASHHASPSPQKPHERPKAQTGSSKMKTDDPREKKQPAKKQGFFDKLKILSKIDKLPKNLRDTIPFRGITQEGIIETNPGEYTRCYRLTDANFQIATGEEQALMYSQYMDFLNSFDSNARWEITIFNHEIDKVKTIKELRIKPQPDGLNKYRNEMNQIILGNLAKG